MAEQVNDNFQVKDSHLLRYYHLFQQLKDNINEVQIRHILRNNNEQADQLARLASSQKPRQLWSTIHMDIPTPSVTAECMAINEDAPSWITPIQKYIVNGELLADPMEAKKLRTQATRYFVVAGGLYRRGFSAPLLKCIDNHQADYVLREIYEGICGSHSSERTMAAEVLRAGYYWPTLKGDCVEFVKKLHTMPKAREPHPRLGRGITQHHLPMAFCFVGHRRTWTVPYGKGAGQVSPRRGGLLHKVDRGRISHLHLCRQLPELNGQAEAANKVILTELKKRLGSAKGAWAEELLEVLWAYRCTPQSTTKETPFCLTYDVDAMIPVEVGEPSFQRQHFHEESNDDSLRVDLDVLDKVREKTQVVDEACKQRMSRRFNSNLKPRTFHEGDLVWRATGSARCNSSKGKISANWDGPFQVRHALHNGPYKLEELSGKVIPRTWNSTHLKTYYS
ncbi:uncharacterized protein LOC109793890 [Cajanus cajan]|uniref:uncharacterized protein LOC109793890 n=1 Tax=Cajanus cajan TaxID=3821 RepID=UPI00098DB980|nr:uncharacterized protein LOC109793890 [Cajanus cajan]